MFFSNIYLGWFCFALMVYSLSVAGLRRVGSYKEYIVIELYTTWEVTVYGNQAFADDGNLCYGSHWTSILKTVCGNISDTVAGGLTGNSYARSQHV